MPVVQGEENVMFCCIWRETKINKCKYRERGSASFRGTWFLGL